MKIPDRISAYLNKRASGKWIVENYDGKYFQKIIVVPALAESDSLPFFINSLEQNAENELINTLLIVVINNILSESDEAKADNQKTIHYIKNLSTKLNIAFIDAASPGKEMEDRKGGVGLARKIGMDRALTIFDWDYPGKRILVSADADCTVDPEYLSVISREFKLNNSEAAVVNFTHDISGNDPETMAIVFYEIFLRYYVLGLTLADSGYAYHSIGSTIVCTPEAYVKTGGISMRKAAEDFYFLEKLAKTCSIGKIRSAVLHPSSRSSWRVPFGTGKSVERFLSGKRDEYLLYNPNSFLILKRWLDIFRRKTRDGYAVLLKESHNIHPALPGFLIQQNLQNFMDKVITPDNNDSEIEKQKHYWFDALRTLKLIHYLRDTGYPDINMFDALDLIFRLMKINNKIKRGSAMPDLRTQKEYLLLLRRIQS